MVAMREIIMNIIVIGLNHHFITHHYAPPISGLIATFILFLPHFGEEGSWLLLYNPLMPYHQYSLHLHMILSFISMFTCVGIINLTYLPNHRLKNGDAISLIEQYIYSDQKMQIAQFKVKWVKIIASWETKWNFRFSWKDFNTLKLNF